MRICGPLFAGGTRPGVSLFRHFEGPLFVPIFLGEVTCMVLIGSRIESNRGYWVTLLGPLDGKLTGTRMDCKQFLAVSKSKFDKGRSNMPTDLGSPN